MRPAVWFSALSVGGIGESHAYVHIAEMPAPEDFRAGDRSLLKGGFCFASLNGELILRVDGEVPGGVRRGESIL